MNKEEQKHLMQSYYNLHEKYEQLKEIEKEHQRINGELRVENKELQEDYNKVVHEATEFESKVYELQDRIDKAVEYIGNDLQSFLYSIEYKTLLEILKGDKE